MRRIQRALAGVCAVIIVTASSLAGAPVALAQAGPQVKFEKYTLANGLQVIFHQDSKLPVVNVNLWYHVGSKNEKAGRTGFAHLFEHMMFQGSKNVKGEYLQLVERAGANLGTGGVNGTTNFDRTNYFETVPAENLEYALWLESDRMAFLLDSLTQENLSNQIEVVKNEKRQGENQPYGRLFSLIVENLFPVGHPYQHSVIGSMEDLGAATLDDVREFFKTYYSPSNATLAIVGDFDPAKTKQLIEKYFGPIAPGPALERPDLWYPVLDGEKRIVVNDRVPLPRVTINWPTVAYFQPDDAAISIAATVLGGGKNSRVYKTLVRDRQIAAEADASNIPLEIAGAFNVDVTLRPGTSLAEVEQIVDAEIARLAKDGPTADEVEQAKAQRETGFVTGLERIGGFGGKADLLNQYNTYLGDPANFAADYDRFQKVTPEQVRAAVNKYLNNKNRLIITYVPDASGRPSSAEFDRTKAPAFGPARAFTLPAPQSRVLPNGLTVIVQERRDVPNVAVNLVVRSGATADPAAKVGVAAMTASMLDEGAGARGSLEIAAELDRLGTSLGTGAGMESSSVSMLALSRNLKPSLAIMSDVTLRPTFAADELDRQRKQRLDAILQEQQNPAVVASQLFPKLVFGADHPYGRVTQGTADTVKALTVEDLKAYHTANYKPNNTAIIFVGDVTMDQAVALTTEAFGSWAKGDVPKVTVAPAKASSEAVVYLLDKQEAQQSQIRVGGVGPMRSSADYNAIELLNNIYGGSFSGRLNLNLRENKGYTYGAFNSFVYHTQGGRWGNAAGVRTDVTKESLAEFLKEARGIVGERPLTDEEIVGGRANLVRGFVQRFESNQQIAGELATVYALGLPLDTLGKFEAGVGAITPEGAVAAAKKYIDPTKPIVLVVGDLSKVEAGIRSLNIGKVVVVDASGKPVTK